MELQGAGSQRTADGSCTINGLVRLCLWLQLLSCCWCSLQQHKQGIERGSSTNSIHWGTSLEQGEGTRQCWGQSPCFSFLSGMFLSPVAFCASPAQIPLRATACCWKWEEELGSSQDWFSILGTDLLVTGAAGADPGWAHWFL